MPRPRSSGSTEADPTFEQAMNELEEIVQAMEDGALPLEGLVSKYERGSGLLKLCRQRLDAAQQRIELITRDAPGGVALSPTDSGDDDEAPAPAPKPSRKTSSSDHANDEIRLL